MPRLLILQEQIGRCEETLPEEPGKDIDHLHEDLVVLWGLTRLDERKVKPTHADVVKGDICLYLKAGEVVFVEQIRITTNTKFLELPGRDANSSRCLQQPAAKDSWDMTTQDTAAQDARPKSRESSQQSTSRMEEQPQGKAKQPASSPHSAATYTIHQPHPEGAPGTGQHQLSSQSG